MKNANLSSSYLIYSGNIFACCLFFLSMKCIVPVALALFISVSVSAQPVHLPNPIMFVVQIPMPQDSAAVTGVFCNHTPGLTNAARGSDLYIIYPDGILKNLTQSAGYGMTGLQTANSIAVREPSIHW